jgi:hypothetical protein
VRNTAVAKVNKKIDIEILTQLKRQKVWFPDILEASTIMEEKMF